MQKFTLTPGSNPCPLPYPSRCTPPQMCLDETHVRRVRCHPLQGCFWITILISTSDFGGNREHQHPHWCVSCFFFAKGHHPPLVGLVAPNGDGDVGTLVWVPSHNSKGGKLNPHAHFKKILDLLHLYIVPASCC